MRAWPPRPLRRSLLAALVSTALVAGAWTTSTSAQEPPDPAPLSSGFLNGTAKATANVLKVAPGVGSLELALGAGTAVSELRNGLAQAQAKSIDLGLIGSLLGADSGCGALPIPLPTGQIGDQLPKPLRVDNRQGDVTLSQDALPSEGAPLGIGRMLVAATGLPSSEATATLATTALGPLVTVNAGEASAVTRIVDGSAREAIATSELSINIGGVLELAGLRWRAVHRTGEGAAATGTFEIGSATGVPSSPLNMETLAPIEPVFNQLLAPLGLSIQLPELVRLTEPADLVRVTPLRIQLKDSPLGGSIVAPALEATREARSQLFDALAAQLCQAAGALLVADVVTTIVAGAGSVTLDIGGVEATTAEIAFEDPFGAHTPLAGPPPALPASGGPATSSPRATPSVPSITPAPTSVERPVVATGPIERVCESVNPTDWPPCSHGAALPLGLLGLGLTAGVGLLDWRQQARRREAQA